MAGRKKTLIVIGMPRSGTSGIAGAMARLGVYFGPSDQLYGADRHNPGGYWEHKQINGIHRKFHHSLNLRGLDCDPIPDDWMDRPMSPSMVNSAVSILNSNFSNCNVWGWKDPQATTLLPFALEVLKRVGADPTILICIRNPIDVASSQLKRHGTPFMQSIGAWLFNTLSALKSSAGHNRYVVNYQDFLNNPRTVLEPLVKALELPVSEVNWAECIEWVNPSLSHGSEDEDQLMGYPPILSEAYRLCAECAENPTAFNAGEFDSTINDIWNRWRILHDMFYRPSFPEAKLSLSWERGGQINVSETTYRPTRGWQKISGLAKALPESRVSILIYPLPGIVWIRSAIWKWGETVSPAKLLPGAHGQLDSQNGFDRVWLFSGTEQVATLSPSGLGPFELEMDILIETSNVITGMTFQNLSQRTLP